MIQRQPPIVRALEDLLRLLLLAAVLGAGTFVAMSVPPGGRVETDVLRRAAAFLLAELLALATLRLFIPAPKEGSHLVGVNKSYIAWLVSATFGEVAMYPIVRAPFWLFYATRFLYLQAVGARVAWGVSLPSDVSFRAPSLVNIETGAQIEPGVHFETAIHARGRVHVAPISVGGGTLVGAYATLMPGASIGHDARIGPGVYIGTASRVGVSAAVGEHAVIAEGVDVGSYATIGPGSVLSKGVTVADRARVLPGTVVPQDVHIGEREVWEGAPARRSELPPAMTS